MCQGGDFTQGLIYSRFHFRVIGLTFIFPSSSSPLRKRAWRGVYLWCKVSRLPVVISCFRNIFDIDRCTFMSKMKILLRSMKLLATSPWRTQDRTRMAPNSSSRLLRPSGSTDVISLSVVTVAILSLILNSFIHRPRSVRQSYRWIRCCEGISL